MSTIVLSGDDRLQRELVAGQRALADMKSTHAKAAQVIQRAALPGTPRRTGRLAASQKVTAGPTEGMVTSHLVYAPVIHWGWRAHNIDPQPWLSKAAQSSQPQWLNVYEREIERILSNCEGGN